MRTSRLRHPLATLLIAFAAVLALVAPATAVAAPADTEAAAAGAVSRLPPLTASMEH